ncbi:centrosomal protein of 97 kDa-like [Corticium candelabrum]|uniref:centrosomal protein of 97 kDa-like n=1 Tax=Corticium candelabrum TaxID=121492 RepID=UPI002E256446|nr:centrosomal protein of 97 kDa-like [Corticium candelabrum]
MNLSGKQLTEVPALDSSQRVVKLFLDINDISNLNGIEHYERLETLSFASNRVISLNRLQALRHVHVLNAEHNNIADVDGLSSLHQLEWLSLAGNNLKDFSALRVNVKLSHLNVSDNSISSLGDISTLKNLKALLLHGNILTSLRNVPTHLPASLAVLTLADNEIHDLIQVSYLSCLSNLTHLTLASNPCVLMTAQNVGFNYRPFVLYFCPRLATIESFEISSSERDISIQLFPDGRGCPFGVGQNQQLAQYLALHCPLTTSENLHATVETETLAHRLLSRHRQHASSISPRASPLTSPLRTSQPISSKSSPSSLNQRVNTSLPSLPLRSHRSPHLSILLNDSHLSTAMQSIDVESLQSQQDDLELRLSEYHEQQRQQMTELFHQQRQMLKQGVPLETVMSSMSSDLLGSSLGKLQHSLQGSPQSGMRLDSSLQSFSRMSHSSHTHLEDDMTTDDFSDHSNDLLDSTTHYLPLSSGLPVSSPQKSSELEENDERQLTDHTHSHIDTSIEIVNAKRGHAATLIQACVRGYQLRRLLAPYVEQSKAAVIIQSAWRGYHIRKYHPAVLAMKEAVRISRIECHIVRLQQELACTREQSKQQGEVRMLHEKAVGCLWEEVRALLQWKQSWVQREMVKAATRIQAAWRGYCTRKQFHFHSTTTVSSLTRLCKTLQSQVQELHQVIDNLSAQIYVPGETTARFHRLGFTGGDRMDDEWSTSSSYTAGGSEGERVDDGDDRMRPAEEQPASLELQSQDSAFLISGTPTTPGRLSVSQREGNSVTLQWSPASPRRLSNKVELPVLGYHVYVDGKKTEMVSAGSLQATMNISPTQEHQLSVRAVSAMGESVESNSLCLPPVESSNVQTPHSVVANAESDGSETSNQSSKASSPTETSKLIVSPRDRAANLLSSLQQEILGDSSPHDASSDVQHVASCSFFPAVEEDSKENQSPNVDCVNKASNGAVVSAQQNGQDVDARIFKRQPTYEHSLSESNGIDSPASVWSLYSLPSRLPNLDFSPSGNATQQGNVTS